jgi:glyoxylase-like metal-dependent hydrolase (beta-lactamase superfamily II)
MLRFGVCLFLVGLAASPAQAVPSGPASNFEVQTIAEGVYAVIRQDPPGLMVDANSVFIVNEDDVVVVDTSGAPSTTKEVVAALRKITNKPVRYVINTHWHDDHIIGDTVYREAFPGVDFIGHAKAREYLPTRGAVNRKGFLEGAPMAVEILQGLLAANKSFSGEELTAEERTSHENDIRLAELAVEEGPGVPLTLPTITVEDRLTLHRGNRTIDIRHLGRGHTAGDLVVHLPKESVVITGDLVVWPVPFVGGDQSYVGEWSVTLEKVLALKPAVIIPGHGPVLRDDSYVKILTRMFASIQQQTAAAVARGETLVQARKSVDLEEFRKILAGDSQLRSVIFSTYVTDPAVTAAFREASAKDPV